jgi:hypothetical protein
LTVCLLKSSLTITKYNSSNSTHKGTACIIFGDAEKGSLGYCFLVGTQRLEHLPNWRKKNAQTSVFVTQDVQMESKNLHF